MVILKELLKMATVTKNSCTIAGSASNHQ